MLRLERTQLKKRARLNLDAYIEYLDYGVQPAKHQRLLTSKLDQIVTGEIRKLMVWMPPGSAKSTYTSVLFPPYFLGRITNAAILGVSNTTDLAERFSRRSRNIVASPRYREVFRLGVSSDSQAAGQWETNVGGEFFAAGVGTAIAGRRADLGLIDDPIKSREEADSERTKEKQFDWYKNDFVPRLKPKARQIIIQTRWAEDDLSGRILEMEGDEWTVLSLPMEALPDDPLGRKVGDRLWPEWFTDEMVVTAKKDVRAWNSLYQQDPVPASGIYFESEDARYYPQMLAPRGMHYFGASDYAVKDGGGDFTEMGMFGYDYQGDLYIVDWWRGQKSSKVWIEKQCDLILKWKPLKWFGESGVIQKAVQPFLKKRMEDRKAHCQIEWLPSIADKPTRARPFQALFGMSKVFLPEGASFTPDLYGQLMKFPAGKYDDGVDVCSLIGRGLEDMPRPDPPSDPTPINIGPRSSGNWMS